MDCTFAIFVCLRGAVTKSSLNLLVVSRSVKIPGKGFHSGFDRFVPQTDPGQSRSYFPGGA
jgi:hypothetical protein